MLQVHRHSAVLPPSFRQSREPNRRRGRIDQRLATMAQPTTRMALRMLNGATRRSIASASTVQQTSQLFARSTAARFQSTQAAPTGQQSPFIEPAGRNPAEDSAPFSAQLQEYGAWM